MDLIPFLPFFDQLSRTALVPWRQTLEQCVLQRIASSAHGDLKRWELALDGLPEVVPGRVDLRSPCVGWYPEAPLEQAEVEWLRDRLMDLHPWRKGPYSLCGVHIDSEWRSDWKWDRVCEHITPLAGRLVLDVGCGNGYHAWRMLGAEAGLVLGIDPGLLSVVQFQAVNRYLKQNRVTVLPLALEDLPMSLSGFDTVFSMGVLYHRRSPIDHLLALRRLLRPGGELILETLVLPGSGDRVLVPPGRYAAMRNCWFIPSVPALIAWLERCGFVDVRALDITQTSTEEQRATQWMHFQSLADQLDPKDPNRTLEGHPAPTRAVLIAHTG